MTPYQRKRISCVLLQGDKIHAGDPENTNTLIVRAPPELRDEIREFVEQIDKQAATQSNRHVRVIQLRQSKSDRMQSVLQQFLSTN